MTTKQQIRIEALAENAKTLNIRNILVNAGISAKHVTTVYEEIISGAMDYITNYNKVPDLKMLIRSEVNFYFSTKQMFQQ